VLNNLLDQAQLGIVRIDIYKHGFLSPLSARTTQDKNGSVPKKV